MDAVHEMTATGKLPTHPDDLSSWMGYGPLVQRQGYAFAAGQLGRHAKSAPGSMYEVNLHADPEAFLNWDKPLGEQGQPVLGALKNAGWAVDKMGDRPGNEIIRQYEQAAPPQYASKKLNEAGIPGIRYLDQGSRGTGEGTSNYVMFDDKLIEILRKYGLAGLTAGAGGAPFYTLANLKTNCPNATVVGFGVNIGSNNPSYNVETDLVNFNGTTYNFEPYVLLNDKEQCFHNGYKTFTNPSFANQGQCVRWVEAQATGNLKLADPSQQIKFNVTNDVTKPSNGERNTVSYTNFDYPGGLSYQADVTCSYVNPETKEARFMFQIPSGHPGLSGLYVVAYVKEVRGAQPDQYGHAATADLATATQWCQTGTGFSPTMYPITQGRVEVNG